MQEQFAATGELNKKNTVSPEALNAVRTCLVVALVCFAMPFIKVLWSEGDLFFSLWQLSSSALQYSDAGSLLPASAGGMLIFSRVMAWAEMVFVALAFILTFNPVCRVRGKGNLLLLITICLALLTVFVLYYYVGYILKSSSGEAEFVISFANGGLALIAALAVALLLTLINTVTDRMRLTAVLMFAAVPLTILFGSLILENRKYFFISLLVIFEMMLPFFLLFENRKPQARELVIISVVAAIAVVGRAVFFMIPNFQPMTAIIIIAGACLGPEAGFLTGAMATFVSNFFFGQGPWTPWQMFAYGIIGFLTGVLFKKGILKRNRLPLCIYGGIICILFYGVIMNAYTVFTMDFVSSWLEVLAVYASGLPVDCIHAFATVTFLFFLAKPMMAKIERITTKYCMTGIGQNTKDKNNKNKDTDREIDD